MSVYIISVDEGLSFEKILAAMFDKQINVGILLHRVGLTTLPAWAACWLSVSPALRSEGVL